MFVDLSLVYVLNMAISVSSTFLLATYFIPSLWPNKIPLCIYTMSSSIHSSVHQANTMDVQVLLWNADSRLLQYTEKVNLRDHMVDLFLVIYF